MAPRWIRAVTAAVLGASLAAPAQAHQPAATGVREAAQADLWQGLHAGMSPQAVHAALRARGIQAELKVDGSTRESFVEAQSSVDFAGRRTEIALGFVENALFYIDLQSHKSLARRAPAGQDHFSDVLVELSKTYGSPVSLDAVPAVTQRNRYGHVERRQATFERSGIRADVTGNSTYTDASFLGRSVQDVVTVRFWTSAGAKLFLAGERRRQKPPAIR